MTVSEIYNVIALRASNFLFVHRGELFFNVTDRKEENKCEDKEKFEGQYEKRCTKRKDQQGS